MKLILSRKGFDSEFGGCPSPILSDDEMISFPIPANEEISFSKVYTREGPPLWNLMQELQIKKHGPHTTCHLDPDIYPWSQKREPGWKACFGQSGSAQSHLMGKGVGVGDLFLFFGYFRKTEQTKQVRSFIRGINIDKHVIYGWLQVGQVIQLSVDTVIPDWLKYHPHCSEYHRKIKGNCIYIAEKQLSFAPELPGSGFFRATEDTILTKKGMTRSKWDLDPNVFGHLDISYHSQNSWKKDKYFQSASKGQEFVVNADEGAINWAHNLVTNSRSHYCN